MKSEDEGNEQFTYQQNRIIWSLKENSIDENK